MAFLIVRLPAIVQGSITDQTWWHGIGSSNFKTDFSVWILSLLSLLLLPLNFSSCRIIRLFLLFILNTSGILQFVAIHSLLVCKNVTGSNNGGLSNHMLYYGSLMLFYVVLFIKHFFCRLQGWQFAHICLVTNFVKFPIFILRGSVSPSFSLGSSSGGIDEDPGRWMHYFTSATWTLFAMASLRNWTKTKRMWRTLNGCMKCCPNWWGLLLRKTV